MDVLTWSADDKTVGPAVHEEVNDKLNLKWILFSIGSLAGNIMVPCNRISEASCQKASHFFFGFETSISKKYLLRPFDFVILSGTYTVWKLWLCAIASCTTFQSLEERIVTFTHSYPLSVAWSVDLGKLLYNITYIYISPFFAMCYQYPFLLFGCLNSVDIS